MRNALALVILVGTVGLAGADNPHFLKADGTVNGAGALVVSFKEAGLGSNANIDYLLSTLAEATYQCFNNGNNAPQGQPYQVPDQALDATGTFASGKNGSITASLTAGPPSAAPAEAVLKCVSGGNKKLCLMHVSYSGTTIADTTNGVQATVTPSPAERSFPAPSRRDPAPGNCQTSA